MLTMIKGVIFDLPAEDQEKVKLCANQLRDAIKAAGQHGAIALALVGIEAQVEDEKGG
jgi:hypothetical protein